MTLLDLFKSKKLTLSQDGMTASEIAGVLGVKHQTAGRIIRDAVSSGEIEYAGRKSVANVMGVMMPQPAYRIKAKAVVKAKGKK